MKIPGFRIEGVVHESHPRIILRGVRESDGRPLVLKTVDAVYPSIRHVTEIEREYQITRRLAGVPGVIQTHDLVKYGSGNLAIVMEPFGRSLADLLIERDGVGYTTRTFLPMALSMAAILGRIHQHGVVHKDVVPRNILLRDGEVCFIDFGISSELAHEAQDASRRLEGSLPYIAPEQTGRMNRTVDYRADYYALGVTFFELLTGQLPFSAENTLGWIHNHISRSPPGASEVQPDIPRSLSDIILKLMSKNAEDRYQSAFGLIHDLKLCQSAVEDRAPERVFPLGTRDLSRVFQIPEKLYGREPELEVLREHVDFVSDGGTEICLVSGYSGVGKSALVNELSKRIVGEQGYLIQGKFDQFQQQTAYSAISQALRALCRELLTESPERLAQWKTRLQNAMAPNAQVMVDLVPELVLILGEQPPVPQLGPTEAQNRLQLVCLDFLRVFDEMGQPLVIFIDDLQWSDGPTLALIHRLITARDMSRLFVIGAYRSNEVSPGHPLSLVLDEIRSSRGLSELSLAPLDRSAVDALVADTLHRPVDQITALSAVLHTKSRGNPFFIGELLKRLHQDGAIRFDADTGRWDWEMSTVHDADLSDNVVAFMVQSLRMLPDATQRLLRLAACIGGHFDLRTLGLISQTPVEEAHEALHEALRRGMIAATDETYRYTPTASLNPGYRFQHDRVQQAAYTLIDPAEREAVHLSIGRLILSQASDPDAEDRLFEVVSHLNEGRALIDDPAERHQLAEMNLEAAARARSASSYDLALSLVELAQDLLPGDAWSDHYELAMTLARERQLGLYLTGAFEDAEQATQDMLDHARTDLERAECLAVRTRQYATMGKMRASIEAAIAGLELLGIDFRDDPDQADVDAERAAVQVHLAGRQIADLIDAPPLTDPTHRVAIELLMEIFPAAFLSAAGHLFPYLVLKSVNLSLQHGNGPESAFNYAAYGMILCGVLDEPALGYQYGKLAVEMNEKLEDITLKSRVIYVYTMFIHHWTHHWSTMTPWFKKTIEYGYQSGDMLYLAYGAQDCVIWDPKLDLAAAAESQQEYLTIVRDCAYQDSLDSGTLFLQMQRNFLDLTDGLTSMSDADFDEAACVAGMRERGFMTGIANYQIYKAEIHYFYGDYEGAYRFVLDQDRMIASAMSLPQLVRFYLVSFLTRTALFPTLAEPEQVAVRTRLGSDLEQMTSWAAHCPTNFLHIRHLMEAELARIDGHPFQALDHFEAAIAAAHQNEFRRDEALANELPGRMLSDLGRPRAAEGYTRAASYLYYRWGAIRKVSEMQEEFGGLLRTPAATKTSSTQRSRSGESSTWGDDMPIDMSSVVRASQAISSQLHLSQLWKTTMALLLENAGAQRGWFVVRQHGKLFIESYVEAGTDDTTLSEPLCVHRDDEEPLLPVSLINSVIRTREPIILHDATEPGRFATDPYIQANAPKSILCIPVQRHEQFAGAIYMENTLTAGAFTEERVEVINLLSAQATISMENAKLYDEQVALIRAQQRFVPSQFLESLGHHDIARVGLGEYVSKEMSVMFSDLRGFTPMAEKMSPGQVIEILNDYFSSLSTPIADAGGFIDSFNGDEIMALFGVTADHAVRAGIEMWRALERFNTASVAAGGPALRMGMGMTTGPLVLGTVGGLNRLKCGVVGDTVNLASRIEQLTKIYDVPFLIGDGTHQRLKAPESFAFRVVDRVLVKGKAQAVTLYEVLDANGARQNDAKRATRVLLETAWEHYLARDFATASDALREAMDTDPEDPVLALLHRRSEHYRHQPPPEDWNGTEHLQRK